ncbi:MAG TPA: multiheme c-type cytochrome, partial [Terriglobales bacterium]|nr:multiheme c-type cytochrome [Terriglobales bacterium]
AAPAWAAVFGEKGLTAEQVNFSEQYQPGGTRRPPHPFVQLEGNSAMTSGCEQCHSVGRPNADGTIGTCTACHSRHTTSVRLARLPSTCAQCHMGPDHSQIEIYEESKHGVMFQAQERLLNLDAPPKTLTTRDMFVPTCATCHMSGINGIGVTHDPSERLSYYLANAISEHRPNWAANQARMKQVCSQCHTPALIERVYTQADQVVLNTNARVTEAKNLVDGLRKDGVLSGPPFSQPIDFTYFDLWHYDGRTSKHGAFMGGADFVQWHGNYPMLQKMVQLKADAAQLRKQHGR